MNLNLQICSQGEEQNNKKHNHEFCVLSKYHKHKHFFIILDIENMNCAQNCHSLKKNHNKTIQQQRFRTPRFTVKFGSLNRPSCGSLPRYLIFSHLSDIHDDISEIAVTLLHNAKKGIWRFHPETVWCHFTPSVWKVNVYTIWQCKPQLMNSRKIFLNPPINPAR